MKVLTQQLSTKGVYPQDVVAGSSDGGGENMGIGGVHKLFEAITPGYVRRRCMAHLSWRTTDAGLTEMNADTWALSTYLRDGVTWSRLVSIATQPISQGGLALITLNSQEHYDFARSAPPSVLEDRPATNFLFLQWLLPKQHLLTQLIPHDVAQRGLRGVAARAAASTMTNQADCIKRYIDVVLLHKGLYLFHKFEAKPHVVTTTSYEALLEKASNIITSLRLTDYVLDALQVTRADVSNLDEDTVSWLEVAVMLCDGVTSTACDDFMPDANAYHACVSLKMASHLRLTMENLVGSAWASGGMLQMDAFNARTSARAFHDMLKRTTASNRTAYESEWANNDQLMAQLSQFCDQEPPVLLWRNHGQFKDVFNFLAPRFLASGDSVLDCESIHARWKWLTETSRAVRFRLLNALVKLHRYSQLVGLPHHDDLYEIAEDIRSGQVVAYNAVAANAATAPRMRALQLYAHRFNIGPDEIDLLKERVVAGGPTPPRTADIAWGQYARWLFVPGVMYKFAALSTTYFFVAANKSIANRDRRMEDDAIGRSLSVAFFEERDVVIDGVIVQPTKGFDNFELELMDCTIAELSKACGFHPAVAVNATARDVELLHESMILGHDAMSHTTTRIYDEDHPWLYKLSDPTLLEEHYIAVTPMDELTKMGIARQIQLLRDLTDAARNDLWANTKAALFADLALG